MKLSILTALALNAAVVAYGQTGAKIVLEATSPLGTKFYSIPDDRGVVEAAKKALAEDPKNPDLYLKLAQAHAAVWQDREAVEACTRGLTLAPKNAALLTERGHRELPLRQFAKAREDLSRAVELEPKRMDAYYHLGLAHYFLGEFATSAEAFRHAVEFAPNDDERINSTNWVYAALRRANRPQEAARALNAIPAEMKNTAPHTLHYLNLVRLFQGRATPAEITPPVPPRDGSDTEAELAFDTVSYGMGNWELYNGNAAKAREYFRRVLQGKVWITWGFIGAEREMAAGKVR
ncbi:MAG: tetratricopeptide repeat protein [Bryobacteraceae bacterium]|jgi:tetratricopeptide (TPR) repeat protein